MVTLGGTPFQRGEAHGEELRDLIVARHARWSEALVRETGQHPDSYCHEFLAATDFIPAIEQWTPNLLAEVRGLARGSGLDFDKCLVNQLGDEEWWYLPSRATDGERARCSALAIASSSGQPTLLAQNMDIERLSDGTQVVLRLLADNGDPETLVFTNAGCIGLNGCNAHGIGIACNTLLQLPYNRAGLPQAFVVRALLRAPTLGEGVSLLHEVPHASGQSYLLGDPTGIANLECDAQSARRVPEHDGRVWHTNHPITGPVTEWNETSDSAIRYAAMTDALTSPAPLRTQEVKSILAEAPLCKPLNGPSESFTFGCTVMELSDETTFEIAPGPADRTPFARLTFTSQRFQEQDND